MNEEHMSNELAEQILQEVFLNEDSIDVELLLEHLYTCGYDIENLEILSKSKVNHESPSWYAGYIHCLLSVAFAKGLPAYITDEELMDCIRNHLWELNEYGLEYMKTQEKKTKSKKVKKIKQEDKIIKFPEKDPKD